jgi:hypothetical protein
MTPKLIGTSEALVDRERREWVSTRRFKTIQQVGLSFNRRV